MQNKFMDSLYNPDVISVTWEIVPGRGAREKSQEAALAAADLAAAGGRVHAVTITDSPGGNPSILADYLGIEILKKGIEPLVHFTCKDKNRNQMESQLHALDRAGVRNILAMTGDYPEEGFKGRAKPVFDLDSVHAQQLISEMNDGLEYKGIKSVVKNKPSNFFAGSAVTPFKSAESELMIQYYKMKKKADAGAKFFVTQLGYDARKFHELIQYMKQNDINVPVIGNIYILPYAAGKLMNENKLPGCVVTDEMLADLDKERQAPDKGVEARLMRAAKMYAFMKGMGFAGVHIGGNNIKYEQVEFVIDKGEELFANWRDFIPEFNYPQKDGFYYYKKDNLTGLNTEIPAQRKGRKLDSRVELAYRVSRVVHSLVFEPDKKLFGMMKSVAGMVDGKGIGKVYHGVEKLGKELIYDCRDCGDCALIDTAYVCPMSQCPKNQRNGACGGSRDGWCEVYPKEKKCIYVRAYSRLKNYNMEDELNTYTVSPCNWELYETSAWINYYGGKDHSAERLGL